MPSDHTKGETMQLTVPRVDVCLDVGKLTDNELATFRAEIEAEQARRATQVITLSSAERALLRGGELIQAIKLIRDRVSPCPGLKQVRDACEAYRATIPGYQPGYRYNEAEDKWVPF